MAEALLLSEEAADAVCAPPKRSAMELVLHHHPTLVDTSQASRLGLEAASAAMAPATRAAITADLKCYLGWALRQRPAVSAIPARPETLVHYLRWLAKGSKGRVGAKPATLARRVASIAKAHRILGFGDKEPLPTQAGMVRDTLKAVRREKRSRQRQAAPLRLGQKMSETETVPAGLTVQALLASCGTDLVGLRDAALISLAYDAGLRVSELVAAEVAHVRRFADSSGRLDIAQSKTDQEGEGALAWLSPETMMRLSTWLEASDIRDGPLFRRINLLAVDKGDGLGRAMRAHIGAHTLTRQGVVSILRRRAYEAIDQGLVELEAGDEVASVRALSAHSFRVGLTQDLFAAGEDGSGIALALRWSSPTTALRYARELAAGSNAAARVLGKMRV